MYKITYSKIAFASTVILILFFSTTTLKAQSLVKKELGICVSEIQPNSNLNLDSNTSNLDFQKNQLIDFKKSKTLLFNLTLNVVDEADELIHTNVIYTIQFLQYYKQFHLFYKNVS
jgi:hypothetical protein